MKSEFEKKLDDEYDQIFKEQNYWDKDRNAWLPRLNLTGMDLLSNVQVHREQLKMLHHLDSSVVSLKSTLDKGISATPYDYVEWMDSLGGAIYGVRQAVEKVESEQKAQTRALKRIADALEKIAES